jgi:hypothetical protein
MKRMRATNQLRAARTIQATMTTMMNGQEGEETR